MVLNEHVFSWSRSNQKEPGGLTGTVAWHALSTGTGTVVVWWCGYPG